MAEVYQENHSGCPLTGCMDSAARGSQRAARQAAVSGRIRGFDSHSAHQLGNGRRIRLRALTSMFQVLERAVRAFTLVLVPPEGPSCVGQR